MSFARTVREARTVQEFLDENRSAIPNLEKTFDGLKWRLARRPEEGYRLPGVNPPQWIMRTLPQSFVDGPIVVARYTYDENTVDIHGIRIAGEDS